jgi:hypothetical protein
MPFSVGASGVWKNAPASWIGVSGVWKFIAGMWVGVGGAWKNFFSAVTLNDHSVTATRTASGTASAQLSVLGTGIIREIRNGVTTDLETWLTSGSASDYDFRMTMVSGTSFGGSALGTWLNAASTLTWALSKGSPEGINTGTATLEIAPAGSASPIISATITITARWFAA